MGSNKNLPLVSCIMPTSDRRRFAPLAIKYFFHQDYPRRELIIIDDGVKPIEDLVPHDPRIRYMRLEYKLPLGSKRNLACQVSNGKIIVHWDDDDWMAPWRLSFQVTNLIKHRADINGLHRVYHYNLETNRAWIYIHNQRNKKSWLAGGTFCYTKSFWKLNPFLNINNGEDTAFVWSDKTKNIVCLYDPSFYVAMIHSQNSSLKTIGKRWYPIPKEKIQDILGTDRKYYEKYFKQRVPQNSVGSHKSGEPIKLRYRYAISEANKCNVTVSIPYFKCKKFIKKSVKSILSQTHRNLTLVVVNDGDTDPPWGVLSAIDDPRLIRFDLKKNYGRYFADAVVLNATTDQYFLMQDADDWSQPERISESLREIRVEHADAVISNIAIYNLVNGSFKKMKIKSSFQNFKKPLTPHFYHRLWHVGLFNVKTLNKIGGYYGGFNIGYDSLIMNFLMMTSRISIIDKPLYNRLIRPNSLQNSRSTGLISPKRDMVRKELQHIYHSAFGKYCEYLSGLIEIEELYSEIRKISRRRVSQYDQKSLSAETERLRIILKQY